MPSSSTEATMQYEPLPKTGRYIRLLHLSPGRHLLESSGVLTVANLDALEQPYIAVSYVWGPEHPRHSMLLNDCEVSIHHSLYELLLALNDDKDTVTLWTDALCVNQSSVQERNEQVAMMGEIFSKAERVSVWLGSTDVLMSKAFKSIRNLALIEKVNFRRLPSQPVQAAQRGLDLVLSHPYWTRAWVVQELVLAQDISFFFWNAESISWQELMTALSVTEKEQAVPIRAIARTRGSAGKRSFSDLLLTFGHLECTLLHDKFFSLYGMANDLSAAGDTLPLPNYNDCVIKIFMQHLRRFHKPPKSPLSFVSYFLEHFRAAWASSGLCKCHKDSPVELRLPLHGVVKQHPQEGPRGRPFFIHRDGDIYRFRRFFRTRDCEIEEADLVFEMEYNAFHLVVRPSKAQSGRNVVPTPGPRLIGFVVHGVASSIAMGFDSRLTELTTGAMPQLRDHGTFLSIQMKVKVLMRLACILHAWSPSKF